MNTSILKTLLLFSVLFAVGLSTTSCWYARQAVGFLGERIRAVPVDRVSADPDTPDDVLELLRLVEEIREFSRTELGLDATKNYTRYVAIDKNYVADVVNACANDSFSRYYWRYPIVGNLPYRGFYDKASAEKEAARLRAVGMDVVVRKVDAFSSLGYFIDPLYSFMTAYAEDELAELIIHESAHASLFIQGADQFNEEFATFIGRKGAELFLEKKYGIESKELASRRARDLDAQVFVHFLKETARQLDEVYANSALGPEEKLKQKADILSRRAAIFKSESRLLMAGSGYQNFDMTTINNAYLDLYRLYEDDMELYERWYDCIAGGLMVQFVSSLKELSKSAQASIKEAMKEQL